jgi:membrane-associated phospholipid phosphatase
VRLIKLALLLVASLVCYSRIVLGAHYLSDVLAGAALALPASRPPSRRRMLSSLEN